ncbi:meiotic W68 [Lycorma delicatula]|uniref:meiotic W68 n=1 Tax=Lycorma delicatula TaxID=130591 RepID=UPI003F50F41E
MTNTAGFLLGAILFIIYINDLCNGISKGRIMFADDTTFNYEAKNVEIIKKNIEKPCLSLKDDGEASQQTISFGAVNSKDKLSKVIYLLSKIYMMLAASSYCTVRELYYQNISLFQSQSNLNSALSVVYSVLDVIPLELSLQSTSKGLIVGSLNVMGPSGELLEFNKSQGLLIPQDVINLTNFKSNARFVLVVEKDATFQKLLDEKVLEKLGPCVLITGKGFPDINTRLMLRRIWEELKLPIFALVDGDPHGIEIMCVYRFGSLSMSQKSKLLAVPALQWIGVHPTDIKELCIPGIPLTTADLQKAKALQKRPYVTSNPQILSQVNVMIDSNIKCEIEGFSHISSSYLSDVYVRHKVCCMELV